MVRGTALGQITDLGIDTPSCDIGIYRATVIPSLHPSDLEMIVGQSRLARVHGASGGSLPRYHGPGRARLDRARGPRDLPERATGRHAGLGLLGAASITDRETHPRGGIHFAGAKQFNNQGTDTINYEDDELCGVRILGILPNRSRNTYREIANLTGERGRHPR